MKQTGGTAVQKVNSVAMEFIDFSCKKILDHYWSPDPVVGCAEIHTYRKEMPMVSTKTLFNYIEQYLLHV